MQTQSVAIIGAGLMGCEIAAWFAIRHIPVMLYDRSWDVLHTAMARVAQVLLEGCCDVRLASHVGIGGSALERRVDLAIEAVTESMHIKKDVLASLVPLARTVVTNTSTIPVSRLLPGRGEQQNFCGLHFCHPVISRRLVEIIPAPQTDPFLVQELIQFVNSLRKLPVVIDGERSVLNRLLFVYLNTAWKLVELGYTFEQIDQWACMAGMEKGPFRLLDEIGIDTAVWVGVYSDRTFSADFGLLLVELMKKKELGRKTGKGIYTYSDGGQQVGCNVEHPFPNARPKRPPVFIQHSLFEMLAREMDQIKSAGCTKCPCDMNKVMVHGLGFPAYVGCPLKWSTKVCMGA